MPRSSTILAAVLLTVAGQSSAQLAPPRNVASGLPALPDTGTLAGALPGDVSSILERSMGEIPAALRQARLDRIDALVRNNRQNIERDFDGAPARRGVLLLLDADAETVANVSALGFAVAPAQPVDGLDLTVSQIGLPAGMSLASAQKLLASKAPGANVSSDQIFFRSGGSSAAGAASASVASRTIETPIGLIDGAPAQPVTALKGFAKGAPFPSSHGSAVAALAYAAGARKILVADVYGTDPAGGNALAIAQGMGWLLSRGVKVISLSLVGPRSPLLERAVASAQVRGAVVVAAVGNDGPASPPAYPASYSGVLAITGVDKRNRPLIEAGRAAHLDYAAPGADILALNNKGKLVPVRGTSFAAPLVATRVAAALDRGANPRAVVTALDAEAVQISRQHPDPQSGRGLLCAACR